MGRRDQYDRYDDTRYERLNRDPRISDISQRGSSEYKLDRPSLRSERSDYGNRAYSGRLRERDLESERRNDRGFMDRAGDELLSWFGDEEAERRRRMDALENERRSRTGNQHESRLGDSYTRRSQLQGDEQARNVMTHAVVCVNPSDTVEHAARLMSECDCGALPVVDRNKHLIGMITDRDIAVRLVARGVDARRARVFDCMTDEVFACHEYDSVEHCLREMARHQVRRMPIVNDYNRVIGIVSQSDLAIHAKEHRDTGERRAVADMLYAVSEPSSINQR